MSDAINVVRIWPAVGHHRHRTDDENSGMTRVCRRDVRSWPVLWSAHGV